LGLAALGLVILGAAVWAIATYVPVGVDWETAFLPAIQEISAGRNPYDLPQAPFLNTPWILIPLIPLAGLPLEWSWGVYLALSFAAFAVAAYRLGASPLGLGFFMASPMVLHSLLNGNIEWIILLGFGLPPQLGLFLVLAKPQMSFVVVLLWAWQAWQRGGWPELIRVFGPVTLALAISFLVYGLWITRWADQTEEWWNASLFPYSIPIGLVLTYWAFRRDDPRYAMPAGPCFSPYILLHSWVAALAAVLHNTKWTVLAVLGLWLLVILRGTLGS
jgi:hypothetical protein